MDRPVETDFIVPLIEYQDMVFVGPKTGPDQSVSNGHANQKLYG
jgi:hypothetical protein